MVQERQVLLGVVPAEPASDPQGVEVDHRQDRAVVVADPHQEVAGVEVLVDEPGVVEPGGQDAERLGEVLADPGSPFGRPVRQPPSRRTRRAAPRLAIAGVIR